MMYAFEAGGCSQSYLHSLRALGFGQDVSCILTSQPQSRQINTAFFAVLYRGLNKLIGEKLLVLCLAPVYALVTVS